ncbi:MAG: hypothetical protein A2Y10_03230 [Planctomycetes bacterium GWF2_41_51]|nr:MAG: hypothetical protein A2Y10_03230 [Planctomycetes bacterium GWF2_41_51]HBG28286.1 hypothetical protein [Phycisphaerales bacterium]
MGIIKSKPNGKISKQHSDNRNMANFIAIIDSDSIRRTKYINSVKEKLSPIEGLCVNSMAKGNFCTIWAANKYAPLTTSFSEDKAAVVFGRPVGENQSQEIDANTVMNLWSNQEVRTKSFYNGFYAAIVYNTETGLTIGADILGVYPVYYWTNQGVLLAASSPEMFKYHPLFTTRLNPQGLISVLLTMHLFDGQTLLKDVKRLGAGCILCAEPGKKVKEETQYKIRLSMEHYDLPFSAHIDILANAVEDTIIRHTKVKKNYSLLLSGGLDSRMLAGFLNKSNVNFNAITLGMDSDIEMQIAKLVARNMGLEQSSIETGYEEYSNCAQIQAKWEHIANGFNDIFNWGLYPYLEAKNNPLIMGHSLDAVIGTRYINWAYSSATKKMSFDSFFSNINNWAIRPEILKRMLNKDIFSSDMIDGTIDRIKKTYNSASELESQKAWCFNLYNRQRFHVAGAAFAMCFGAWPVIPALDRKLLECAASIPAASIAERRAQTELFCSRFPKLASLPIDRNSYDTTPLKPRIRYLAANEINKRLRRILGISKNGKIEHRYYYRIYDFNNQGWQEVRREAEAYRGKLYDIFDKDVLNELIPAPDVQVKLENKITDASGLKLLTGLMLWSKGNL